MENKINELAISPLTPTKIRPREKDACLDPLPREKLVQSGAQSLSDKELIAILLGSGNKDCDVFSLATKVLDVVDRSNAQVAHGDLVKINGIGAAKACLIAAAFELARRRIAEAGQKIREPEDIIPIVQHLCDRKQETFICISLSGAHEVIASRIDINGTGLFLPLSFTTLFYHCPLAILACRSNSFSLGSSDSPINPT